MKNFLYCLVLLASACLGFGLVKGCQWLEERNKSGFWAEGGHLVTGVGDAPGYRGFTLTSPPPDPASLFTQWRALWATTVGIQYSPAWTRDALIRVAAAAHNHQMAVVLFPAPIPSADNPYPKPLPAIAADAQAALIDRLCISWLNVIPDPSRWRQYAADVRKAYSGKIILAVDQFDLPAVDCWDCCDFIGVAGPIELPGRLPHASDLVEMKDFRVGWDCRLTEISAIGTANGKKIALLNMEVPVRASFKLPLPGNAPATMPKNPKQQAANYEALILETKGRDSFINIMLLPWSSTPAPPDTDPAYNSVNLIPFIVSRLKEDWDPKKPREIEPPLGIPPMPDNAPGDTSADPTAPG